MTSEPTNDLDRSDLPAIDSLASERCMEYLLGELTPPQSIVFEQQLALSAELNRELLVQAEILFALSAGPPSVVVVPPTHSPNHTWRTVSLILTLAACVAVAFVGFHSRPEDDQSVARLSTASQQTTAEALLIAQAWAANRSHVATNEDELGVSESALPESEFDFDAADAPDDDSVLAWMVVGVAADADTNAAATGATSDG